MGFAQWMRRSRNSAKSSPALRRDGAAMLAVLNSGQPLAASAAPALSCPRQGRSSVDDRPGSETREQGRQGGDESA